MSPKASACRGVVLQMVKYRDADRLVEALTDRHGRVTLLARGARASKKRFAGVLDLFVTLDMQVQPPRAGGFFTLVSADVVDARLGLRQSLDAILRAGALCACVREIVPPAETAPAVAEALEAGLDALAAGAVAQAAAAFPRLARLAGLLPHVSCASCRRATGPLALDDRLGGFVCAACAPRHPGPWLSEAACLALGGARITDEAVARDVQTCVRGLLRLD